MTLTLSRLEGMDWFRPLRSLSEISPCSGCRDQSSLCLQCVKSVFRNHVQSNGIISIFDDTRVLDLVCGLFRLEGVDPTNFTFRYSVGPEQKRLQKELFEEGYICTNELREVIKSGTPVQKVGALMLLYHLFDTNQHSAFFTFNVMLFDAHCGRDEEQSGALILHWETNIVNGTIRTYHIPVEQFLWSQVVLQSSPEWVCALHETVRKHFRETIPSYYVKGIITAMETRQSTDLSMLEDLALLPRWNCSFPAISALIASGSELYLLLAVAFVLRSSIAIALTNLSRDKAARTAGHEVFSRDQLDSVTSVKDDTLKRTNSTLSDHRVTTTWPAPLNSLPLEILIIIVRELDRKAMCNLRCCSRDLYYIFQDNYTAYLVSSPEAPPRPDFDPFLNYQCFDPVNRQLVQMEIIRTEAFKRLNGLFADTATTELQRANTAAVIECVTELNGGFGLPETPLFSFMRLCAEIVHANQQTIDSIPLLLRNGCNLVFEEAVQLLTTPPCYSFGDTIVKSVIRYFFILISLPRVADSWTAVALYVLCQAASIRYRTNSWGYDAETQQLPVVSLDLGMKQRMDHLITARSRTMPSAATREDVEKLVRQTCGYSLAKHIRDQQ